MDTGTRVRITVREKGVYSLSDSRISALLGLSAGDVRALIGTGQFCLSSRGGPVAYLPATENAGIIFYGKGTESPYTDENVYWLDRLEGLRMAHVPGAAPAPAGVEQVFTDTAHAEEDLCALPGLFNDPTADYWTWAYLVSGDATTGARDFTVAAEGAAPVPGESTLIVHLKGGSSSAANPDHHAQVSFNGAVLGECAWDGTEAHDAIFSFNQALLRDGANTVTVKGLLDTGAPYSIFHVDSFDLAYRRYSRASRDVLHLTGGENVVATVSGFSTSDLHVMDISDPSAPKVLDGITIDGPAGDRRISFAPASPSAPYCAFASSAVRTPDSVAARGDSGLRNPENRAGYLIVTSDELRDAAQALAAYRGGRGSETMVVTYREIIDEFNDGISAPEAIRSFLSYAYRHWAVAPRYVVLAGDGTYDYKNLGGYGGNLVPPLMVGMPDGLFASDTVLGDVEGDDGIPEIAVGRLPAQTAPELQGLIDKIIAYETAVDDPWMSRVIMLADNPDIAGDFTSDSEAILALMPDDLSVDRVYLAETTASEARDRLMAGLSSGAAILNYFGHGGVDRLAAEALLTAGDAPALANAERLPLVTAMTCNVGRFCIPGYDCLAEILMLQPGGGAIAVWSPTALSVDSGARLLAEEFYRAAFKDRDTTVLGDIVLEAEGCHGDDERFKAMVDIYNILGDPALNLRLKKGAEPPPDTDGDGLSDDEETLFGTDPAKADSDMDGFSDLLEIISGTDPLRAVSNPGFLRINFQPAGVPPPPHCDASSGERLVPGRSHGWR
jgi:hypothetical protein